jgi:hypothetical protein
VAHVLVHVVLPGPQPTAAATKAEPMKSDLQQWLS